MTPTLANPNERGLPYRSDKAAGPTAGTETVDPLEFLARFLTHIPDSGQVMQRGGRSRARGSGGSGKQASRGPASRSHPTPSAPRGITARPGAAR